LYGSFSALPRPLDDLALSPFFVVVAAAAATGVDFAADRRGCLIRPRGFGFGFGVVAAAARAAAVASLRLTAFRSELIFTLYCNDAVSTDFPL
jgi:hypothetical protein|tara:strand:- start:236 stop:514 length:279 start_codon:yes stop_codon:yes gene_type:complete